MRCGSGVSVISGRRGVAVADVGGMVTAVDISESGTERLQADLTIATHPSNDVMTVGQEVFFNVLVSSLGGTVSTGVVASDRLPAGFSYLRHEANAGSYDPASGEWTIGTIPASWQSAA